MEASAPRQATVRDLVAVVFRQKWVILTIFAVTTISVFLFNLRSPTVYESSAKVQVRRGQIESTQSLQPRYLGWEEEMGSELETVKSYPVSRRAQEILDQEHAEGRLNTRMQLNRGGISAKVIGESNVLEIAYASQDAAICRPATNAVAEAYAEFRKEVQDIPGTDEFFTAELTRVTRELAELEQAKEAFLERVDGATSRDAAPILRTSLASAENNRLTINDELVKHRQQLATARRLEDGGTLDAAFVQDLEMENWRTVDNLRENVIRLRLSRDEKGSRLTPDHPEMRAINDALASAENMLGEEIASTITVLQEKIDTEAAQVANLDAYIAATNATLASVPSNELQLDRFDHLIELKRTEMKDLAQTQVTSRINSATRPTVSVTVLAPAGSPFAKKTKDYVRMALAPMMSLVVGFLIAFFLDSVDHTLRSAHDLEEQLGVPVLAALPESRK